MRGFLKYLFKKAGWYLVTFVVALALNFFLPRLIPGNPVMIILSQMAAGMTDADKYKAIYEEFSASFGLNLPLWKQFFIYVGNLLHGDMGRSFVLYPREVSNILASTIPFTLAIQLPSIFVGWIGGNLLGAVAAYKKGVFDKAMFPFSLFISSIPSFVLSFVTLFVFSGLLKWFPISNAYAADILPSYVKIFGFLSFPSWTYFSSLLEHWILPFLTVCIVMIGGQAIGMRSMSLYELNADYVLYAKLLGVRDKRITRYVFRNAMLPQVTGLALSLGSCVGGALIVEIVFSYPGVGRYMYQAIRNVDYTVISGCTLLISVTVLIANFLVEIVYGLLDPRVRSAQTEEG